VAKAGRGTVENTARRSASPVRGIGASSSLNAAHARVRLWRRCAEGYSTNRVDFGEGIVEVGGRGRCKPSLIQKYGWPEDRDAPNPGARVEVDWSVAGSAMSGLAAAARRPVQHVRRAVFQS
jgi:hypothetical protein